MISNRCDKFENSISHEISGAKEDRHLKEGELIWGGGLQLQRGGQRKPLWEGDVQDI